MTATRTPRTGLRAALATLLCGATLALGVASPAAADTRNQVDVGPDVNCNLNGLHQGAGPVSTCGNLTIVTEVLVNGVSQPAGYALELGDVVTVRLTVTPRGGHDAFYQETVDGIRNNGGGDDMRFALDIGLPGETGTELSAPTNVTMSRTDNGDRGNGPLINCLAHSGTEGQRSDGPTAVTLGGGSVGANAMSASVGGGSLNARWNDMAWDRCVNVLSNNGFYAGHVIQFDQTVDALGTSTLIPTWNLGQVRMERTDGSRVIRWGSNADQNLTLPAAPYVPGPAVVDDGAQVDATYAGQAGTSVSIDVLANDAGLDPYEITALGATTSGGTVDCGVLPGTGPCTYEPPVGFSGTDTFTYTVTDANGSSTAQVVVNVLGNQAPDADDDLGATSVGVDATGNVLDNDTDADGDDLAVTTTPVTAPTDGTVVLAATGEYTYTPDAGFFGTDTFSYEVCDSHPMLVGAPTSRCSTATVTVVVDPGDGPDAVGDLAVTDAEVAIDIDVLANDDAGDSGPVTITGTTAPVAGGTVTCAATCTYTPPAGFSGTDGFTYTVTDAVGRESSASVVVEVLGNRPPVAVDDAVAAEQDGPAVTGDLAGNDLELDGEALTYTTTPTVEPTLGTVEIAPDGTFTYTPTAGASGTDTFGYEVCDDHQTVDGDPAPACSEATVTVVISPTPLVGPVAVEDGAITDEDIAVDIDVLANDDDPDGDPTALTIASAGYAGTEGATQAGGTVTCEATCTYTPPLGFSGTDAFTYVVEDADGGQASALVLVTVVGNLAPVAADDFGVVPRDGELTGSLVDNDVELDDEALVFTLEPVVAPQHGTVEIAEDGTYTYVPEAGFVGVDEFVYEVCDDHTFRDGSPAEACSQAKVTVLVGYATVADLDTAVADLEAQIGDLAGASNGAGGSGGGGGSTVGGVLARTGTDARFLAGLGLLAIAGGGLVLVGRRRRSALG